MFLLVVALVESTSVPLRIQAIFLLFHHGTNMIIIQGASGYNFLI